jgi:hypothetical protein
MPLLTVVPGNAAITVTMQVYVDSPFPPGGGIRIRVQESATETNGVPDKPSCSFSRWQSAATNRQWVRLTYSIVTATDTRFFQAGPELRGAGTAYFADVHVRFTEGTRNEDNYRFMQYATRWCPDAERWDVLGSAQGKSCKFEAGHTLAPNKFYRIF